MSLTDILERLKSDDATDRLKAAAELGEEGTPNEADNLVHMIWNDPAPTVQQIAVQAYTEIMGDHAFDEVNRVINNHNEEYVVLYAINMLGNMSSNTVSSTLGDLLDNNNEKIRTAVLRSIIKSNSRNLVDKILDNIETEKFSLAIQNTIEALALWRIKKAKNKIITILQERERDIEIKTIALFALASFGGEEYLSRLKNEDIDSFRRITVNGKRYSGRKGLLLSLKEL